MSDPLHHYSTIAAGFRLRLDGVTEGQWAQPVPSCPAWTVRDLVAHVIGTHHSLLGSLGQPHEAAGEDLAREFDTAHEAVATAMHDPEIADQVVAGPFGQQRFADLVGGLLANDTIFHTWDLAQATGQDATLDAAACERALKDMAPMDAMIRKPGLFSARLEAPADADAQARLLAFGGRRP